MAKRPSPRRRQRSTRITVAAALLLLAAVVVTSALIAWSVVWLGTAAVVTLVCAFAATRIVYLELLQDRRAHAAARAAQAQSYRDLTAERVKENSAFNNLMTGRLGQRNLVVRELEGALALTENRAQSAEGRAHTASRRVNELEVQVADLEARLEAQFGAETVADLLGWEEHVIAQHADAPTFHHLQA